MKLKNKERIWVLFTETPLLKKGIDERIFFLYQMNKIGKRIDEFESYGASTYLYDFSAGPEESEVKERKRVFHWNF